MALAVREQVSLSNLTTFRLGGDARFFVEAKTLEELREAIAWARERSLPHFMLGGGSNVVFPDQGFEGLVIVPRIRGRDYDEDTEGEAQVMAGAGESWDVLVEESVAQGFWGLENLSLIPGTVGATPVQNVGAYGVEVADVATAVEVLDAQTLERHVLSVAECCFGYRDSIFKHEGGRQYIITRVAFRLHTKAEPKLTYRGLAERFEGRENVAVQEVRAAVVAIRREKLPDPREVGTAGSFFKNPVVDEAQLRAAEHMLGQAIPNHSAENGTVKIPLAWILEKCGWKGVRRGSFGTWPTQPLCIVHYGGGTTGELALFARDIMHDIKAKTAITIEPEVRIVTSE